MAVRSSKNLSKRILFAVEPSWLQKLIAAAEQSQCSVSRYLRDAATKAMQDGLDKKSSVIA
jgi:hypothetical protein